MRFIVYGAGAVGGVIGARLAQQGREVVLIARGEHLVAMRQKGLTIVDSDRTSTLRVAAVGHPGEIRWRDDDVVLLTMKSQDTADALDALRVATDRELPIVCAQNGVANERMAARRYRSVYGMLIWLPSAFLEPGQVVAYSAPVTGLLDAGAFPNGRDALIAEVTAALDASGFSARPQERILYWKYKKLLSNLYNALRAVLGEEPAAAEFGRHVRAEAVACFEAAGIEWASDEEEEKRREEAGVQIRAVAGQPPVLGSSWQSLERKVGTIETDYLNGEIVLLGRLHGVPTPYNRALQRAANRLAQEGRKPGSLSLAELEALVMR